MTDKIESDVIKVSELIECLNKFDKELRISFCCLECGHLYQDKWEHKLGIYPDWIANIYEDIIEDNLISRYTVLRIDLENEGRKQND